MTKEEIYEKYYIACDIIRDSKEHIHAKSLALNETHKWLETELDKLTYPIDGGLKSQIRAFEDTLSINKVIENAINEENKYTKYKAVVNAVKLVEIQLQTLKDVLTETQNKLSDDKFHYVIGYFYNERMQNYRYNVDFFYGNLLNATNFLQYCKKQDPKEDWKLYKVNFEEIN